MMKTFEILAGSGYQAFVVDVRVSGYDDICLHPRWRFKKIQLNSNGNDTWKNDFRSSQWRWLISRGLQVRARCTKLTNQTYSIILSFSEFAFEPATSWSQCSTAQSGIKATHKSTSSAPDLQWSISSEHRTGFATAARKSWFHFMTSGWASKRSKAGF